MCTSSAIGLLKEMDVMRAQLRSAKDTDDARMIVFPSSLGILCESIERCYAALHPADAPVYTTYGTESECCGHRHNTQRRAQQCLDAEAKKCDNYGIEFDRRIVTIDKDGNLQELDGSPVTCADSPGTRIRF